MLPQKTLALLEACKSIKQALQVHAQIIHYGLQHHTFSLSRLISFFALLGSKEGPTHAKQLFSQIDSPNVFIYNTMIRGYSRSNSPQQALVFYTMLCKSTELPNNFTFPFVLSSCSKFQSLGPGCQVHCHIVKLGFEFDLFVRNALLHLYCIFGKLHYAEFLFEESFVRDIVSYNAMINGFAQFHQPHAAFLIFKKMKDFGLQPDEFSFVALLSACSSLNNSKTGKIVHCLVYKNSGLNMLLETAILEMYAKAGLMEIAERVFSTMRTKSPSAWSSMVSGYSRLGNTEMGRHFFDHMDDRDVISWTAMISGYTQAGQYTEALELLTQMEALGVKPDDVTLVSALSACAGLGVLDFGKRLHYQYIKEPSFGSNIILTTAIIEMYAKCGSIGTALDIFRELPVNSKTTTLYNSMINGLAQHGLGKTAINVFREMEVSGLKLDGITFVAILSACVHSGLVKQGREFFESMSRTYEIKPWVEHYGCMVDLLGRDGQLTEAYNLIQNMPYEGSSVLWRTLLGACRIHGNVEMAAIAARKLLEVEPEHGGGYVLLSNMLSSRNQWKEAGKVRKEMEDNGIKKPAGWSCIELNGVLHQFVASDKSLQKFKELKLMLERFCVAET
ncbi:hypothetical protein ACFE04_020473 [Oxalis oulophora]